MKKIILGLSMFALATASVTTYTSCKKNAAGRNTLALVDDASVLSLSNQQYTEFLSANPPVNGTPEADMVRRVGAKMTLAVQQYLAEIGKTDLVSNYSWEFNLVNNPEANAWCLPGGKIVVYTGIMPLFQSDEDLAIVMGHEIAHAVLKHGNERMSQQLLVEYGGAALSTLLSTKPAESKKLFETAYGVSSTLGVLAFSRKQENEADETGLYFAAMAKYDPNVAVGFWQRMAAQSSGSKPPVFLSTHPSDESRIDHIKEILPKAMEYYNK